MTNSFLVSIIVANFNGENFLPTCLNSVLKSSYKNYELILVDDGSTDKSIEIIKRFLKKDRRVKLLRSVQNLGAAASRNKAIKVALGKYIVFLDNDTEVTRDWLSKIIEPFDQDPQIGGVQSLLLDFTNRDLIQTGGGLLIPFTGWLAPLYQWTKYKQMKDKITPKEIIAVSASLAVRKEVVDLISGFDEKEAVYTEDLDFCWRIWISGYKIILFPDSIAYHLSKSVEKRAGMNATYQKIYFNLAKNSFRSILKNYGFLNILRFLPSSLAVNLGRGLLVLYVRGQIDALSGSIQGLIWNIVNIGDTLEERSKIQKQRKVSDSFILQHVGEKGSLMDIYNKHFRQTKLI